MNPDYDKYSLEELKGAKSKVDRHRYPERYRAISERIDSMLNGDNIEPLSSQQVDEKSKRNDLTFRLFVIGYIALVLLLSDYLPAWLVGILMFFGSFVIISYSAFRIYRWLQHHTSDCGYPLEPNDE